MSSKKQIKTTETLTPAKQPKISKPKQSIKKDLSDNDSSRDTDSSNDSDTDSSSDNELGNNNNSGNDSDSESETPKIKTEKLLKQKKEV